MKKTIVHVGQLVVSEASGVGRVMWHWKNELEKRGYDFIHIGKNEVGKVPHKSFFPYKAYQLYKQLGRKADAFLVHEPVAGPFVNSKIPAIVYSHGSERRSWEMALQSNNDTIHEITWSRKITFPLWNLRQCDIGFQKADLVLTCNQEDTTFAENYYHHGRERYFVMRNGVNPLKIDETVQPEDCCTILFLGSWIKRKGIETLVEAAQLLYKSGLPVKWLLVGTCVEGEKLLEDWPEGLRSFVEVIPFYPPNIEESFFARSNIFVLPSFFEGQSLAILQALEAGRCCITTSCCGQLDLIQHGENGLLHEPGNAQQLASLIEQCVKDKEFRTRLGRNAKASVKDRSWENVSAEIVDKIEKVLAS
jgi:glycosyltransferase involved in cell wall biosynthesis